MKRFVTLAVLALVVVGFTATTALAEGYNNGNYNWTTNGDEAGYADNAGIYVRTPTGTGIGTQQATFKGPHGNYSVSTNKCQDCHSTHYATGSYMLLRANSRENACTFCHAGGGGSATNIQMDNTYDADGIIVADTRGMGTGHSMGYTGNAPADIKPAFSDTEGFACFDCHSPHGNSARVMTTFANPGRAVFTGAVGIFTPAVPVAGQVKMMVTAASFSGTSTAAYTPYVYNATGETCYDLGQIIDPGATVWGLTPVEGNFVIQKSGDYTTFDPAVKQDAMVKPVWGTGRFLLLKNPDNENGAGVAGDITTSGVDGLGNYNTADNGINKLSINWTNPLGPADSVYGGIQDANRGDSGIFPSASTGILALSEFCTDCHDGAAGSSGQPANVWLPNDQNTDPTGGQYKVVYSHDAQPRH